MRYFAHVVSGIVQQVIVAEPDFINALSKQADEVWVETFTDASQRKHYAGIGFTYDVANDAFIPPKPFASWTLDADALTWKSPVSHPGDGTYLWDEQSLSWAQNKE